MEMTGEEWVQFKVFFIAQFHRCMSCHRGILWENHGEMNGQCCGQWDWHSLDDEVYYKGGKRD